MFFQYGWIDTHCHLAEPRISKNLDNEISEAKNKSITGFISSALSADEFDWHLKKQDISEMKWCAGIHPIYDKSQPDDFDAIVELSKNKQIAAIGEIGLDKRKPNYQEQKKNLLKQLELARSYNLPVIFHIVKYYYQLYKIIKDYFPSINGIIHSFNSSLDVAKTLSGLNIIFSLGSHLPKLKVLDYLIKNQPYCFETDAPYQKNYQSKEQYNHLKNLIYPIDYVSKKVDIDKSVLQKKQYQTLKNIL